LTVTRLTRFGTADAIALIATALCYVILAKLGLALASINPSATPIWPPTGLAIAALLVWGQRLWPAILVGAFIANVTTAGSLATSVAIAAGNTLEAVVAVWLINIWSRGRDTFASPVGVAKFGLICLGPSAMISATIGVVSLSAAGFADWGNFVRIWTTWWLGDLAGALVFTPFLVLWAEHAVPDAECPPLREVLAIFATAVVIGVITFSPLFEQWVYRNALGFLIVVPLLWAALRCSQRETATVAVILSSIAVWGTYVGSGLFARADVNDSFLMLLMFLITVTMPSLTLSVAVAQRRHAEQELRRSHSELDRLVAERTAELADKERQFRLLVQGVSDYAIVMLDPEGYVRSWNIGAERINGYRSEEAIGLHFSVFYPEGDRARGLPDRALSEARSVGAFKQEGQRIRKDGSYYWASVVIQPIYDDTGDVVGFAKVTRDITAQRDAEQRLQLSRDQLLQAQKMEAVGQLTGGVAHDFNNLLTVILGNLESAERGLDSAESDPARLRRAIANAVHGARRAATLTQHLLAFSRRQPLVPRPIDVNKFISDEVEFLSRTLGERIHVRASCQPVLWRIEADESQLATALLNLAVNARDAMPDGGNLTIAAENVELDSDYCAANPETQPGQYVQISMTDTGTGMAKPVMERAFEPFFSTKSVGEGTGLGLSQVYGFAKQSGGHVRIVSEPGRGTTVTLYFPRLAGRVDVRERPPPGSASKGRRGETILVVEDEELVRDLLVEVLRELHYQVIEAADAKTAMHIIERPGTPLDLLLSDVVLPGMNGRDLADRARALRPGLKVLFMTGYSRDAIMREGRLEPDIEMVQKPVTRDVLAARIRDLLDTVPAGEPS
jgi:PAS domain S-box-containing protein